MTAPTPLTQDDRAILAIAQTVTRYLFRFSDRTIFRCSYPSVENGMVHLITRNAETAQLLLREDEFCILRHLHGTNLGLTIWIGDRTGRPYSSDRPGSFALSGGASMLLTEATASRYIRQNLPLVANSLIQNYTISVHRADSDQGHEAIAVVPRFNSDDLLCKPRHELVGCPALSAVGAIGFAKHRAIEGAIASRNGFASEYYEFLWEGMLWEFRVDAARFDYDSESEVVLLTQPATPELVFRDTQFWQQRLRVG